MSGTKVPETVALRRVNNHVDGWVRRTLQRTGGGRGAGRMAIALLIAFAFFAIVKPAVFLSPINLQNLMVASPEIGIISIAIMLAMLTGGIDLSLVSIASLSAITISTAFTSIAAADPALAEAMGIPLALLGVAVGALCGLVNAILISVVGITPILATLGTMQIFNGIAVVWTGGTTLYGAPAILTNFGRTAIGPVPMLFVALLIVAVLIAMIVNRTALGRRIQLLGANPVAATYSGFRSGRILISTYLLGGSLAGLAGVLFLARNPTASADYGASYVLLVIVIAVLGGTRHTGGFASVAGVLLATLTLQVVSSGFTALRLSSYEYAIAQGAILVGVMVLDAVEWRRPKRRRPPQTESTRTQAAGRTEQQ
ncbi:ABC transporter permease [Microbacterium karelineae]|uniref:ABC transporter permease n=1 Tax=Microbacterium karelineae TaxID=2654283 RepID=UPI001E589AD3|nr:ABC transporter permease [Microbacterium karelineae]